MLNTTSLLCRYLGLMEKFVDYMVCGVSVGECVVLIEKEVEIVEFV